MLTRLLTSTAHWGWQANHFSCDAVNNWQAYKTRLTRKLLRLMNDFTFCELLSGPRLFYCYTEAGRAQKGLETSEFENPKSIAASSADH